MKYKVGDKVRVKSYEKLCEENADSVWSNGNINTGVLFVASTMKEHCGKIVTIVDADKTDQTYGIKEDGNMNAWEDWMLEDVEQVTPGNKLRIKYHVPDMTRIEKVGGKKSDWIDLRTAQDEFVEYGQFNLISLGVSMQLPYGHEAHVVPRSSTFKNFGIIQTNHTGIIDESYCGDNDIWHFPAFCLSPKHTKVFYIGSDGETKEKLFDYLSPEAIEFMTNNRAIIHKSINGTFIPKDSRICQFRLFKHQEDVTFEEVDSLGNADRGGIGSTGTK